MCALSELTSFIGLSIAAWHLLLLNTQRYYKVKVMYCSALQAFAWVL